MYKPLRFSEFAGNDEEPETTVIPAWKFCEYVPFLTQNCGEPRFLPNYHKIVVFGALCDF